MEVIKFESWNHENVTKCGEPLNPEISNGDSITHEFIQFILQGFNPELKEKYMEAMQKKTYFRRILSFKNWFRKRYYDHSSNYYCISAPKDFCSSFTGVMFW